MDKKRRRAFDFKLPSSGFHSWLKQVENQTAGHKNEKTLVFDNEIARGQIIFDSVQEGLDFVKIKIHPYGMFNYVRDVDPSEDHFSVLISIDQSPFTIVSENKELKFNINAQSKIILLSPKARLKVVMNKNSNYVFIIIFINKNWINQNLLDDHNENDISKLMDLSKPAILYQNIESRDQDVIRKFISGEEKNKLLKLSQFLNLISTLFTSFKLKETSQFLNVKNKDADSIIEICKLIDSDIKNMSSLEVLAKEAGMSLSKFKYTFKNVTGMTPYQYHLKYKLERAKDILMNSNLTVSEVGYLCGYQNMSHFSRVFKKLHGVLPSYYKN